jgi:threonine dehydrogenase-like Zn-dependent dehydrogenase
MSIATICPQLLAWAESGRLSVHIHARFALEDYQKAFEAIAKRQKLGKTQLQCTNIER